MPCTTFGDSAMETHLTSIVEIVRGKRIVQDSEQVIYVCEMFYTVSVDISTHPLPGNSEHFPLVSHSDRVGGRI